MSNGPASANQDVVVDWMVIDGLESAQDFTATPQAEPIRRLYRTSISGAIDFSVQLFENNNYSGLKRVIDVSGDGSNNQGRPVTQARDDALAQGITINGLPHDAEPAELRLPRGRARSTLLHRLRHRRAGRLHDPDPRARPVRRRHPHQDPAGNRARPAGGLPASVIPAQFSPSDC